MVNRVLPETSRSRIGRKATKKSVVAEVSIAAPQKASGTSRLALTRELIEDAALALIDQDGLEVFSTRRLGERLGCQAMSIYHHFPSKAHILDALVDRSLASIQIPQRKQAPEARLRSLVRSWRQVAIANPRLYPHLSMHRWNSDTGVAFLAEILACFHDAGLKPESCARQFRVLCYFVLGATLDEIGGYANGASSMRPISDEDLLLRFPQVAKAGRYFRPEEFERTFELGLDMFLRNSGLA
jgi:AcrR family transcriptional regulator